MKTRFNAALVCLAAAFFCGCASKHTGPVYHAGDENPPDFLAGPVGMVLTNLGGFSAHVSYSVTTSGSDAHTSSGELLGREGKLIFQPTPALKGKRVRAEGGLYFIWNENLHSGYVLSEALQSFAPIRTTVEAASPFNISREGIQEEINGQHCHRYDAAADLYDGRRERLTLWRADEEGHLPVRLDAVKGLQLMTVNFSNVRMEYPPAELFVPPDGFTPYGSSVAMMNELIVRDARFAKTRAAGEFSEPTDTRSSNWHEGATGSPLGQP